MNLRTTDRDTIYWVLIDVVYCARQDEAEALRELGRACGSFAYADYIMRKATESESRWPVIGFLALLWLVTPEAP